MKDNLDVYLGAMILCASVLWMVFHIVRWSIYW